MTIHVIKNIFILHHTQTPDPRPQTPHTHFLKYRGLEACVVFINYDY